MTKKINSKLTKLINYYSLINYNLIFKNQTINRYRNNNHIGQGNKESNLKKLQTTIKNIKNSTYSRNTLFIFMVFPILTLLDPIGPHCKQLVVTRFG